MAIEHGHLEWIFPLKYVIFHSYDSLPEGKSIPPKMPWCRTEFSPTDQPLNHSHPCPRSKTAAAAGKAQSVPQALNKGGLPTWMLMALSLIHTSYRNYPSIHIYIHIYIHTPIFMCICRYYTHTYFVYLWYIYIYIHTQMVSCGI